jgi:O-Antigen ligase
VKTLLVASLLVLAPQASFATVLVAVAFAVWAFCRRDERSQVLRTICVGALVPICGVLPDSVAGLLFLLLVALDGKGAPLGECRWAAPFVILMLVWSAVRALFEFDAAPIVSLFYGYDGPGASGILSILRWLRSGGPGFLVPVGDTIKVLAIVALGASLGGARGRGLGAGLLVGGVVSTLAALCESFAPDLFSLVRAPSPFWQEIHRMRGFATDPNALGVLCGVLIPLAYAALGLRAFPVILALVIGGLYSGSRTFFLVPLVTGLYLAVKVRGFRFSVMVGGLVSLLVATALFVAPHIPHVPTGLIRLRASLNPFQLAETLQSRSIFTRLSFAAFTEHPVVGVGLGRFDEYVVPLSHKLNLGIGVWRDGAVSVYLEVVCELGLLGALLFVIAGLSRAVCPNAPIIYKGVGLSYLVILALLPHTNFPEGVAVAGLLLAQATVGRERAWGRPCVIGLLSLLVVVVVPASYAPRSIYGFFPWEVAGSEFVRWTALEAVGEIPCSSQEPLRLRNETPIAQSVEVITEERHESVVVAQGANFEPLLSCVNGRARYRLNVFPGFSPSKFGHKDDGRILGVRQLSSSPFL